MLSNFKYFLKRVIPHNYRSILKKVRRHTKNFIKKSTDAKSTLYDMHRILTVEFGLKNGDNLIISSSFGNLNADFSPIELVELLQEIVGEEGNLVMPFYPPGNSYEWADSGKVFDMQTTRSSMGVLTQVFSEMKNVHKSMHPTKAVVAWGNDAKEIVLGHEKSKTPYYWDSPYGWLLKNLSKSLSLGLNHVPIFHAVEDIILESKLSLYQEKYFELPLKTCNGEKILISTLVHDPFKLGKLINPREYIKTLSLESYLKRPFGFSFCYVVSNQELFEKCKYEFKNNNFRYKK